MIFAWREFFKQSAARRASRWALSAVLLSSFSCSTARKQTASTATDPFLDHETATQVAANRAEDDAGKRHVKSRAASPSHQARPRFEERDEFDIGALPTGAPADKRELRDGRELARHTAERSSVHRGAIQLSSAEQNCSEIDVRCPELCEGAPIDESPCASAKLYPDEYLCDGGDREYPIHYQDDQMLGLDSEDAAVEYRDELGNRHVKPTNRVCVYSPRFAAVSSITQSMEDVGGGRPMQSIVAQIGVGLANREGTFAQHQRDGSERLVTRVRGSGLTTGAAADVVDQPIAPHGHIHTTTPVLDFAFLRTGMMKQAEEARLAESIQSAVVWSRAQNPVITAKSEQAIELKSEFKQHELVGREIRFKGKLRIVKTADKKIAEPGDIVKFSIRYDNIGNGEVRDVVIVDNLTPRLEYIDDSATCDRAGVLEVEDNGEGSVILRWVLDEPLRGRSGGVVTFEVRVR